MPALALSLESWLDGIPLARIQRRISTHIFPKGVARLAFSALIGRALSHRARSASTKDRLATAFPSLRTCSFLFLGRTPMLVYVRPSNEATDDLSKLARYLFRDGG
jgi:hypothetical protein